MTATSPDSAFASHLAKWRAAEPAMEIAESFAAPGQRPLFRAWGALRFELEHSLLAPSDAALVAPKLGWWGEELSAATPRHPVTRALQQAGGSPSTALPALAALLRLAEDAHSPGDARAALEALVPYAQAWLAAEDALFIGSGSKPATAAAAVAAGLLARWAPRAGSAPVVRERLPMNLHARHPGAFVEGADAARRALLSDLASALVEAQAGARPLSYPCAVRQAFDARRLDRWRAGRDAPADPPAALALWLSWREARRCRFRS